MSFVSKKAPQPEPKHSVVNLADAMCTKSPTQRHWETLPDSGLGEHPDGGVGICKYCGRKRTYQRFHLDSAWAPKLERAERFDVADSDRDD